jgi:DMATS type aromatic prenyltransferase
MLNQLNPAKLGPGSQRVPIAEQTHLELAMRKLYVLCESAGFDRTAIDSAAELLEEILDPWGRARIGTRPTFRSDIGDDHYPIEFSLALKGNEPEVRVLFEAQSGQPDLVSQWLAGQALNDKLEAQFGVPLDRLRTIEALFAPAAAEARYAIWHSVCWCPHSKPKWKVYLNPQAHGRSQAPAVISEALGRLGFGRIAEDVIRCARAHDELKFFSLDLDRSSEARVKIYKAHHHATRHDIERELSRARSYDRNAVSDFWQAIVGHDGPFCDLPITTYLSLTTGDDRPSTTTAHFPVRAYANHDQDVRERLRRFLRGSDRTIYERAILGFAERRLADGVGMHSYVSIRPDPGSRHVTIYLAHEGYRVAPARTPSALREDSRAVR